MPKLIALDSDRAHYTANGGRIDAHDTHERREGSWPGPDDEAARRRWHDHTSLAQLKQLVRRAKALPADLVAILRLPALESLIIAEPGSPRYTQLDGRDAICGFLLSRNHRASHRTDRP